MMIGRITMTGLAKMWEDIGVSIAAKKMCMPKTVLTRVARRWTLYGPHQRNQTKGDLGPKTIKKNTNSTPNKSHTQRARAYKVTSFLNTVCELSTNPCTRCLYSLGPWRRIVERRDEGTGMDLGIPGGRCRLQQTDNSGVLW